MNWIQRAAVRVLAKEAGTDTGTMVSIVDGMSSRGGRRRFNPKNVLAAYDTNPWFRACVERVAFAAAVVFRIATFYIPAVEGYFATNWLKEREYI